MMYQIKNIKLFFTAISRFLRQLIHVFAGHGYILPASVLTGHCCFFGLFFHNRTRCVPILHSKGPFIIGEHSVHRLCKTNLSVLAPIAIACVCGGGRQPRSVSQPCAPAPKTAGFPVYTLRL